MLDFSRILPVKIHMHKFTISRLYFSKGGLFMKLQFSHFSKPQDEEKTKTLRDCILEDLEKTKCDLETAYSGFDNVTDPDLIDCYIYEVNAVMKRYRYLLNQAAALSPLPEEKSLELDTKSPIGALVG